MKKILVTLILAACSTLTYANEPAKATESSEAAASSKADINSYPPHSPPGIN